MKQTFKLFNFKGAPVTISIWFFLLFLIFPIYTTIGIFLSVLFHEIGHATMANHKNYRVFGISIDLFSGAAAIDSNMHDRDALSIIAAGPIYTLILAFIFSIVNHLFPHEFFQTMTRINWYLFLFNILPVYPMDGGQIVRSYANLQRDRRKWRKVASIISLTFSVLMIVYGLINVQILICLFGGYFTYLSLKDLGYIK